MRCLDETAHSVRYRLFHRTDASHPLFAARNGTPMGAREDSKYMHAAASGAKSCGSGTVLAPPGGRRPEETRLDVLNTKATIPASAHPGQTHAHRFINAVTSRPWRRCVAWLLLLMPGLLFSAAQAALPNVHIEGIDTVAREDGSNTALLRIVRVGDLSAPLTVNLSRSGGSDARLADASKVNSVVIPIGSTSGDLEIMPKDNAATDGHVSITWTVTADAAYTVVNPQSAAVFISDDETNNLPTLLVNASLAVLYEKSKDQADVVVVRTGGVQDVPLTVKYDIGGNATSGRYVGLSAPWTMTPGSDRVQQNVSANDDTTSQGDQRLIFTLKEDPSYLLSNASSFTIVFKDDDSTEPQANLNQDEVVTPGSTATVAVTLTAPARHYPVIIPFVVGGTAVVARDFVFHGNELVINSGLHGEMAVTTLVDPHSDGVDKVVNFSMTEPLNASIGQVSSHTITIAQGNVQPKVDLKAQQIGRQTRVVTTKNGGLVTVIAVVSDLNTGDTCTDIWGGSSRTLTNLANSGGNQFVFDPSSLKPGFYKVVAAVTDSANPPGLTNVELQLQVLPGPPDLTGNDTDGDGPTDTVEGFGDSDNDAIPDYVDSITMAPNVLQQQALRTDRFVIRTLSGLSLRRGDISGAVGSGSALVSTQDIGRLGSGEGSPATNSVDTYINSAGYYDFEVHDMPIPRMSVLVVVPQAIAIPASAVYRVYTKSLGWRDFAVNDRNAVFSAPAVNGLCPLPGDLVYFAGLTAGHECVELRIEDGGVNAADAAVNYVVRLTGGVAVSPQAAGKPLEPAPCGGLFCSGGSSGAGALEWGGMLVLPLYALMRNARRGRAGNGAAAATIMPGARAE